MEPGRLGEPGESRFGFPQPRQGFTHAGYEPGDVARFTELLAEFLRLGEVVPSGLGLSSPEFDPPGNLASFRHPAVIVKLFGQNYRPVGVACGLFEPVAVGEEKGQQQAGVGLVIVVDRLRKSGQRLREMGNRLVRLAEPGLRLGDQEVIVPRIAAILPTSCRSPGRGSRR